MPAQLEQDISDALAEIIGLQLTFIRSFKGAVFTSYLYSGASGYCNNEKQSKKLEDELRQRLDMDHIDNRVRVIANAPVSPDEILVAVPNVAGKEMSFLELMQEAEKTIPSQHAMSDKALLPFWQECERKGLESAEDILPIVCGINYKGTPVIKSLSNACPAGIQFVIGDRFMGTTSYLNSALLSLAYLRSPQIVKFVVIDPSDTMPSPCRYRDIPHMARPIAEGIDDSIAALRWCCDEIIRRRKFLTDECYRGKLLPGNIRKAIETGKETIPYIAVFVNDINTMLWDKKRNVAKMLEDISVAWKEGVFMLASANELTKQGLNGGGGLGLCNSCIWASLKIEDAQRYNHFESIRSGAETGPHEVDDVYQTVFIRNSASEQDGYEELIASFYSSRDAERINKQLDKVESYSTGGETDIEEDNEPMKDENGEDVIIADGTCYKKSDPAQKAIFKDEEGRYQIINGDPVPFKEKSDADADTQMGDSMHLTSTDGPRIAVEDAEKRDILVDTNGQTGETKMKEFDLKTWQRPEGLSFDKDIGESLNAIKDFLASYKVKARLDDTIVSPFAVTFSINLDDHNADIGRPQLIQQLQEYVDSCFLPTKVIVLDSLPGTCNIGIGIQRELNCCNPSIKELMDSHTYKAFSTDPNALPLCLGVDHMGKPLVLNLAEISQLVIVGGNETEQKDLADAIITGLMYSCSPYDIQLTVFDCSRSIFGEYAEFPYNNKSIRNPPTEENIRNWCKKAESIIDAIISDCYKREEIIEEAGCETIQDYNKIRKLPRRIVLASNFPNYAHTIKEVKQLKDRIRHLVGLHMDDAGIHFVFLTSSPSWGIDNRACQYHGRDELNANLAMAETLLDSTDTIGLVAYRQTVEAESGEDCVENISPILDFAGGRESGHDRCLGPLVYRSPQGDIHYFKVAKVKDEERNLAIDKWGLTRTTVNDNIPDDEISVDSSIDEGTEVEVTAEPAVADDELPPHTGEDGGWKPSE